VHAAGERVQVVAALERQDHLAAAVPVGDRLDRAAEHGEAVVGEAHRRERIFAVRVESRRDEDELGFVRVGDGQDGVGEDRRVVAVGGARRQRRVDGEARARARADLALVAGARIERPLVGADEEERVGRVK
jgi:hypothetical protein